MKPRVRVCIRPTRQPGSGLTLSEARITLYGWLYARHKGGTLILRVGANALELCAELRWLGLDWDQGPESADTPVDDLDDLLPEAGKQPGHLLAQAIDDRERAVTHVFGDARAEPPQALYRALNWPPPQVIHLPDIAGAGPEEDRLAAYRARGYLPLALANHLARLGWTPRGKRKLLPLEELAARFELRPPRNPAALDLQRLNWFNRRALRALGIPEITALLVPRWQAVYGAHCVIGRAEGTALTPIEWQQALAQALHEELDNLDQAVEQARFAFVDRVMPGEQAREVLSRPYAAEVLRTFVHELPAVESFCYEPIDAWISDLRKRFKVALGPTRGVRSRDVMYVLRAALTGRMDGPCLVEVCQLLGQERCKVRALAIIES